MSALTTKIQWISRIVFTAVFLLNASCAIGFIAFPESYAGAYELAGESGLAAIRGIGVAFLMWNATYPLFIYCPKSHISLGWIIVAQQVIGCIGETYVFTCIEGQHQALRSSIERFLEFDIAGLAIMIAALLLLMLSTKGKDDIR